MTTLGALWQERTTSKINSAHAYLHDGGASVIRIIIKMVREAIQRDWLRTQLEVMRFMYLLQQCLVLAISMTSRYDPAK